MVQQINISLFDRMVNPKESKEEPHDESNQIKSDEKLKIFS